ncbi:DUF1800 domain-containing protein [Dokdonella fugitiva]|uniref:Uncharacterized protein (DUF1800 family) n=1 Tax=Dokdonella fugitiva TaxID=328517 RepID=A0A4R2IB94_9GAMM|nr:DUF1800 domain-containing protein [Dokdonella fugitiva]MBA8883780.1 uncharacterized protein (DUF1800 family) [Dokdonella fugitiva]TCO41771.1 uncharacterized protein (DUF1800 family) [Dokdonella fugitiva]
MTRLGTACGALAAWASLAGVGAHAATHDRLFVYGFDPAPDAPATANEAARFLTQATFGPTSADIARLTALGYDAWLEEQLGKPATLSAPAVEQVVNARTAAAQSVSQSQRIQRWYWQAAYAPDQLRQRMAWALSQIFVVSDQNSSIGNYIVPMAGYYDMLAKDAFASYRTLLGDVTWHPMMGRYLSSFRNQKPSATTSPDENYAREVMQLFSIGLILRDMDFTPILSNGVEIPTYDQTTITHTAKVFTGFTWSDAPLNPPNFNGGGLTFAAQYAPMQCFGTEHFPASGSGSNNMRHDITGDDGTTATPKTVVGGMTIPPNQTCAQDVGDELDILAAHPNVPPFISRQLIQRFVTSNPSPQYIERVATVFDAPGANLGDVVKAILMDDEARHPPALASGDRYGKLREPILRLTAVWRAFNAQAQPADAYGEVKMTAGSTQTSAFGQGPLQSPTVFNFYEPDYQQPGPFADNDRYSPELQILSEASAYSTANAYYNFTAKAYQGMSNPPTDRPLLDLSPLTANATNPAAMVATIDRSLLYGTMSAGMKATLTSMLTNLNGASAAEKAWSAVYLTILSPEFAAQR